MSAFYFHPNQPIANGIVKPEPSWRAIMQSHVIELAH